MDGMLSLEGARSVQDITDKIVNVSHHAMLARFSISLWTARKSDKRLADSVAKSTRQDDSGAGADSFNVIKRLLPPDALDGIDDIARAARQYHKLNTLPWQYDGVGILYSKAYFDYTKAMREYERLFNAAVDEFMPKYQDHMAAAKILLADAYDEEDYPHPMRVRAKFAYVLRFSKVEMGSDFRVPAIGDDAQNEIRDEINRQANESINQMVRVVWEQVHEHVNHVVERLTAFNEREEKPAEDRKRGEGTFRDSLIDNLRDLVQRIPHINITEDPAIEQMRVRLLRQLCQEDADVLRESSLTRKDVLTKATKILADVGEFLA